MKLPSLVILSLAALALSDSSRATAQNQDPLHLVGSTPLPKVTGGDFDHFAVDEAGKRLYVVSEDYASIEVFDLISGAHLQSILGKVKSPRKILFLADKHALFVADAGSASVCVFNVSDFHEIARVPLLAGPDAGVYDPKSRTFYVGNGGKAAKQDSAQVSGISVDSYKVTSTVSVPAATLKTLLIDPGSQKLYATMRDKSQIAVIDLTTHSLETVWKDPALHTDSAMVLDTQHHLVFAGDRKPGLLVVLDQNTGKAITTLPIGDTSDDMTYDADHFRLYISSADGVDVVEQDKRDHYRTIQHIDTLGGKTSIYVPSLHRFYVVHTKGDKAAEAGLQIFAVR